MCCIIKENVMSMEVPGYMRVRAYLYNLAEHATEKNPKIPSENTLCRMFGVSRMTVRSAIKGLIQTQVLQTRRGVGTFVNTEFTQKATVRLPLVGLLQDSGRNVYSTISPAIRTAVIKSGMIPELVVLPDSDDPVRLLEMISDHFAAIIWESPGADIVPHLRALKASRIPLLLAGDREICPVPEGEFDTLETSRAGRGKLLGSFFLENGHERICYVHNNSRMTPNDSPDKPETTSGALTEILREQNPPAEVHYISLAELESELESFRPTVVYSKNSNAPYIGRLLNDKKIAVPGQLSYLSSGPAAAYFFNGKIVACIDDASGLHNSVIEWLDRRVFRQELSGNFHRRIDAVIEINQTFTANRKDNT